MCLLLPCGGLQVVHKQPHGEPLLDVQTEEGQQITGLLASECCLQVQTAAELVVSEHKVI